MIGRDFTSEAVLEVGKYFFPTADMEIDHKRQLVRLPLQLDNWAINAVALARDGSRPFPLRVEFGILNGRYYAEML